MRRALLHLALCAAALAAPHSAATAMGFGRSATANALGQPLDFSAEVLLESDEELARPCVFAEVTAGETRLSGGQVRVTLEPSGDARRQRVRVTTSVRIDEPIVAVDVSIGCASRMSRRFVSFIDPPQIQLAQASDQSLAPQRSDSQVAPLLEIVRNSRAPAARPRPAGAGAGPAPARAVPRRPERGERVVVAAAGAAPATGSRSPRTDTTPAKPRTGTTPPMPRQAGGSVARPGGARLRLEAPTHLASPGPASAPGGATPPGAEPVLAAASAASQAEAALQRERERIQVLEAGLARLRSDSRSTEQTVGALQARLRQAEADRYSNPLVYALAGAMLLFAALAALLWWLRPRQRRRARWFDAAGKQARAAPSAARSEAAAQSRPAPVAPSEVSASWPGSGHSGLPATAPATIGGLEVTTVLGPEPTRSVHAPGQAADGAGTSRRADLSMEELIDLEQQAEFFVVLGQDEAAIELLSAHVRSDGGKSPLPYLQLLEIQQRRGDEAAFERIRHAFHERFDTPAPDWRDDLRSGRSLEAYPQALARVQAIWATPMHAMQTLEALLFRRSEGDEPFDYTACRELLFLYSIARELAEHVDTDFGPIDLFLPLEDARAEAIAALPSTPGDSANMLDLDISSWPADTPAEDFLIVRSPGRRGG